MLVFGNWSGDVLNPHTLVTSVVMDASKTVTANYIDGRRCHDICHPAPLSDFNGDCIVDTADLLQLSQKWLTSTRPR